MFWRMTGLSTASPVETILDKEEYTLEELLDEDEIIQECKALNSRLINFLRETTQVEQLLQYIVEEAPKDAEKRRTFKFPYIACEVFTCEIDVILRTLVENEELMDLLFSFVKPDHPHSTLLAGYFSKVVICLMLRKTAPFMNFIKGHQEIIYQLVDLIGITSIMEVLIRLIGADEHMYSNCMDSTPWLEDMNVLEMIVDKFSSSDSPEVHANAAEVLCAITRYAPPVLAAKISSPSFVGRLFRHALEESRPKSVLVHSLTICISLLDPKRLVSAAYYLFRSSPSGSSVMANPETVDGMLQSLGDLLKILDTSPDSILPTTYGALRPPLGKHRLKIVEFISVLLTIGSEPAEKELIRLGAVRQILDLFFQYPFNNFLHHHVENITVSCLESKQSLLVEHILHDCDLVGKILSAEKNSTLTTADDKPTVAAENKSSPKIGNIGHITRIANKLIQLGNINSVIQTHVQENSEWVEWLTTALLSRNTMENINQWACGRPSSILDRTRDSDDEDLRDRDYDIPTPDVYFGGDSPEVVISSLCLGDDQDSSSLITNSNWFAFEGNRFVNEESTCSFASPSPSGDNTDDVVLDGSDDSLDKATSCQVPDAIDDSEEPECESSVNGSTEARTESMVFSTTSDFEKPHEWVEWRETSDRSAQPDSQLTTVIPNGDIERDADPLVHDKTETDVPLQSSSIPEDNTNKGEKLAESNNEEPGCSPGSSDVVPEFVDLVKTSNPNDGVAHTIAAEPGTVSSEKKTEDKKVDKEAEEKN